MTTPPDITPDTKDWTWVLGTPCPECGYDAAAVADLATVAAELRRTAKVWATLLHRPDATVRPRPDVWSPAEYGAHVRDVHRVFLGRLELMLGTDAPTFANWDQDATALEERYDLADPAVVAAELPEAAAAVAHGYAAVPDDALQRSGLRSDGSEFTVASLARYHLHDIVHHLWDVRQVS